MTSPPLALLLDLDGPLANPPARTIIEPTILPNVKALLLAGIPVVINTGRSADFVLQHVVRPIKELGGLPARGFHAVCEQGAVWFSIVEGDESELQTDPAMQMDAAFADAVTRMALDQFNETMFVDDTKLAMVSVEQRLDVSAERYRPAQKRFVDESIRIAKSMNIPVIAGEPRPVDPIGTVRVHPTIISTDIEPASVGKDLGAQRAWKLLEEDELLPKEWRTVGDSPSDILMADWLHAGGNTVRHIDVSLDRNAPGGREYDTLSPSSIFLDNAGAAYLRWVLAEVSGNGGDERRFERH